jgi:microcystin-dependent protein
MSEPFIAEIRIFAGNFSPRSWAFCNGQLLPISQNTALFSLVGTTYGGDGRTTMALPNMQGRVPMHPGRGPGLTSRRLGERGGEEVVTLSEAQIPSHTHSLGADNLAPDTTSPKNNLLSKRPIYTDDKSSLVNMASQTVASNGGGQSHNNNQPYLALNYIIALQGIYPSRS